MKNAAILALLVAAAICGGLYVQQLQKLRDAEATIEALQAKLTESDASLTNEQKRATSLQERLNDTRTDAVKKAGEVADLQQALTNRPKADAKTDDSPLVGIMKDPKMRELMKSQQKTVLGPMVDKNYASLFDTLKLDPDQRAALKDLIVKKTLVDANAGLDMLSGQTDPTQQDAIRQQTRADKDAMDAQIKQALGDDGFSQFQAYEKTIPERTEVGQFKDQVGADPSAALTPDQEQQLVAAMSGQRQSFQFSTDYFDQSKFSGDFSSYFTDDKISQFQTEYGQLNQQYLNSAQSILSPAQLTSFQQFLDAQKAQMAMGLQMAGKMFAPQGGK